MSDLEWWEEKYAEFLDEVYEPIMVAGLTMDVSRVIREVDPIAFQTGANDHADGEGWEIDRNIDAHGNPDHVADSDECPECV